MHKIIKKLAEHALTHGNWAKVKLAVLILAVWLILPAKNAAADADDTQMTTQTYRMEIGEGFQQTAVQRFSITMIHTNQLTLAVDETEIDLSGIPGSLYADYLTANVITDILDGYHLEIEASEPRLKCTIADGGASDGDYYLEPLAETGTMVDNKWGYAKDDGTLTVPSAWTGVTTAPVTFKTWGAATDDTLGDDTVLWLGTRFNYGLPACTYTGTVTITAVGN
jgi:hypothetical protein